MTELSPVSSKGCHEQMTVMPVAQHVCGSEIGRVERAVVATNLHIYIIYIYNIYIYIFIYIYMYIYAERDGIFVYMRSLLPTISPRKSIQTYLCAAQSQDVAFR